MTVLLDGERAPGIPAPHQPEAAATRAQVAQIIAGTLAALLPPAAQR